ncbi:MAG: hypothetical protein WAM94_04065 [Chromatiaceae bacterium]
MAEPYVVSALVAKLGELAGKVQRQRLRLQRLAEQLGTWMRRSGCSPRTTT